MKKTKPTTFNFKLSITQKDASTSIGPAPEWAKMLEEILNENLTTVVVTVTTNIRVKKVSTK